MLKGNGSVFFLSVIDVSLCLRGGTLLILGIRYAITLSFIDSYVGCHWGDTKLKEETVYPSDILSIAYIMSIYSSRINGESVTGSLCGLVFEYAKWD